MTAEWQQALSYTSIITGLIAALSLFWASLDVPHEMQSWKGKTPAEVRHRCRQRVLKWVGLLCLLFWAGSQSVLTHLGI